MIIGIIKFDKLPTGIIKNRIAGRVTVNGAGSSKRVVVQKRGTLEYVASTMSDPVTGNWEIREMPELPERSLLVEIIDDAGTFDPIAFDNVSQVE